VVAEGVETKEQFDFLRTLGCDQIQGFYFSKPIPASEVVMLLYKTMTRDAAAAAALPVAELDPVSESNAQTEIDPPAKEETGTGGMKQR
jgi:predicted signal transduction protein with EAL and GGDEF domain